MSFHNSPNSLNSQSRVYTGCFKKYTLLICNNVTGREPILITFGRMYPRKFTTTTRKDRILVEILYNSKGYLKISFMNFLTKVGMLVV